MRPVFFMVKLPRRLVLWGRPLDKSFFIHRQDGAVAVIPKDHDSIEQLLLCDPLTGLIAYPSFEARLSGCISSLAAEGVHLAIGDVDDLKEYVSQRRVSDPNHFGHLAGNACMRIVGEVTLRQSNKELEDWPFVLCGTFGGDEVIVAASGRPYSQFVAFVRELAYRIRIEAPRPCSFAVATTRSQVISDGASSYRTLVATVDSALFDCKSDLRKKNSSPNGEVIDIGAVELDRTRTLSR